MLISVVITTYKRPLLLRRALQSIDFSINDLDVIVIDDDEKMSGIPIVSEFDGVRYFAKRGTSRGLSISRNIGIDLSCGKYIIFLDDDDFFEKNAIKIFLENIDGFNSFFYCNYINVNKINQNYFSQKEVLKHKLLVGNTIPIGSYMIEKSSIKNKFDSAMKSHEDWEFLLKNINWDRSKYLDNNAVYIDKTSEGDNSMQNRRRKMFWLDYLHIYSKYPNDELAQQRSLVLSQLGVNVPPELLHFSNEH